MHRRLVAHLSSVALVAAGLAVASAGAAPPAAAATRIIPVPTSNAGLGRIVTAPNGTMWFTEEDADKVGKITPSGRITEYDFPAEFPGTSKVKDLDVAPDGTIWVIYESGEMVRHMRPDGTTIADGQLDSTGRPFGEQVRVGQDGTAWVTMSYNEDFIVRIVGSTIYSDANAPGCEDSLGEAADGSMWCRQGDGLIHVNATGSGGVRYPAGRYAAYPYAIAAGPVGSIWFGRYFSGTFASSPDDGEVGYLNASTSKVTAFDTGSRTAPADLVQGPDKNMWFTSIGAAAGIGHVSSQGRGALTAIGGYEPTSLTFAKRGVIFATDSTNNVIIRVTTDQLQRTNVDPGAGSVFTSGPVVGKVVVSRKPLVVRKGRVPVTISCPKAASGCRGTAVLRGTRKAHPAVTRTARYHLKPGRKTTVRLALTKAGNRMVRPHRVTRLRADLTLKGAKPVRKVVKVRR